MRAIPDTMDAGVVSAIDARLTGVEREHGVVIPWAIESGSRAWGFPSPDSDYDCRFFFVRDGTDYLSPWPQRDVIETPLDEVFDVNGWDLVKAVRLLVGGNATVTEWLRSPIVYSGAETFRDEFLELAHSVADRALIGRHYVHVGRQQWADAANAALKKVFYALRPAVTLRWLREHPDDAVAPMDLPTLLDETECPADLVDATRELIALKSVTRELGRGTVPAPIVAFIESELQVDDESFGEPAHAELDHRRELASAFFRRTVTRLAG